MSVSALHSLVALTSLLTNLASIPRAVLKTIESRALASRFMALGGWLIRWQVLDVLCPQLIASKHFDRIVQYRLNNVLL